MASPHQCPGGSIPTPKAANKVTFCADSLSPNHFPRVFSVVVMVMEALILLILA
jgi:hypothetical protein